MDDHELLKRYAKDGDDGAFTKLVEGYIGMVFGTAQRRMGNRESAEEITQNVFAILARKAATLKSGTVVYDVEKRASVLEQVSHRFYRFDPKGFLETVATSTFEDAERVEFVKKIQNAAEFR